MKNPNLDDQFGLYLQISTELFHMAAEESALGAMFFSPGARKELLSSLEESDFYRPAHRLLFRAFRDLHMAGTPIDTLTVAIELGESVEAVGGWDYILGLMDNSFTAANSTYHGQIVKEKSELRRIQSVAQKWVNDIRQGASSVDVLAEMEQASRSQANFVQYTKVGEVDASVEDIGVPTGFKSIDTKLSTKGVPLGQMTLIVAQEKLGKSALMIQLCVEACRAGRRVLYVSVADLNAVRLKQRMLRAICGFSTDTSADKHGQLADFKLALEEIDHEWRLEIRDMKTRRNATDVDLLRSEIETKQESKNPFEQLFIDYGQKLTTKRVTGSVAVGEHASAELSECAETTGIPFVVGSQVTEGSQKMGTETITKGARKWLEDCGLALLVKEDTGNARKIEIFRSRFGGMKAEMPFIWNDENLIFQAVNPNL